MLRIGQRPRPIPGANTIDWKAPVIQPPALPSHVALRGLRPRRLRSVSHARHTGNIVCLKLRIILLLTGRQIL